MALAVAMSKAFNTQKAGHTKGIFVGPPTMATELHFPNLIPGGTSPPEEAHRAGIGGVLLSVPSGSLGRIFPSLTGGLFSGNTSLTRRRASSDGVMRVLPCALRSLERGHPVLTFWGLCPRPSDPFLVCEHAPGAGPLRAVGRKWA